jgi:hypothetical protein
MNKGLKFTQKTLPLPETLPTGAGKGQNIPFNNMVREMGPLIKGTSGNIDGGFYRGLSEKPLTAMGLRGLGGFTLGTSYNPYRKPERDSDGKPIEQTVWQRFAAPAIGSLVAMGVSPALALRVAARAKLLNGTPADQRIMTNIITQPIVRAGAAAAIGDVAEAANQAVGLPALDGWIKPLLVAGGLGGGLRPAFQTALSKNKRLWQLGTQYRGAGTVNHNLAKFVNHNPLSGAWRAKATNLLVPAAITAGTNRYVIPKAHAYTDNLKDLLARISKEYEEHKQNQSETAMKKEERKSTWKEWAAKFYPRLLVRLETLRKMNEATGKITENPLVNPDFDGLPITPILKKPDKSQ